MKKMFVVLAVTLICGACLFTSCKKDDDLNVKEKIIGKWIVSDKDGQPMLTNDKVVLNFVSASKAYVSVSINNNPEMGNVWIEVLENNVVIDGNKVTISGHPDEHTTVVEEYTVTAINDNEFTAILNATVTIDGTVVTSGEGSSFRFVKVNVDYSADIIGMWEGLSTGDEGSEFDDGENHRWEYLLDGTFNYFHKVNDQWQISDDDYADYFVAGNLLCTRWKNAGAGNEEHREWWEITINGNTMYWTALRQREDGTTYTATFQMAKQ